MGARLIPLNQCIFLFLFVIKKKEKTIIMPVTGL